MLLSDKIVGIRPGQSALQTQIVEAEECKLESRSVRSVQKLQEWYIEYEMTKLSFTINFS